MAHKINHREVGAGAILILVHGYGGSVMHWDGIVKKLKDKYRVVTINISHLFLSSDKTFFSVQVETLAKYLKDHFPDQKLHIAGTSYGGALAWGMAVQHPEMIEKLVLINPMVPDPKENLVPPEIRYFLVSSIQEKVLQNMLTTPIGKALLRRFASAFRDERTHGVAAVENLKGNRLLFVGTLIFRFIWILKNEDWKVWQSKLVSSRGKVPTMLIYDREDAIFKAETYKQFAEDFGCIYVHEITGAGHLAIKARPDTISNFIEAFMPVQEKTKKIA
jgi:pimeloyl-ACP methyl ester carboxylesterase